MVEIIYGALRNRQGLGQGDAAVLGLIGAFVGWEGVFAVVGLSALLGLLVGVPWMVVGRRGLAAPLPFVPFLGLAGLGVYISRALASDAWREGALHWLMQTLANW